MLLEQGIADQETLAQLVAEQPLGNFLRRLVGLDGSAAKDAFGEFATTHKLNADQTEFIDMIVDHLTDSGIVEPATFYESPFSDLNDMGLAGVLSKDQAVRIIDIVKEINSSAEAA